MPPILPPPILNPWVLARCEASLYAVSMSLTAMVKIVGVGALSVGAKAKPVTCEDLENSADESAVKLKPVMAVPAMGETAMLPVMEELGTVEIPDFVRIA
mmetsp:Transcript_7247/g.20482  ORF Transcript_7247/g.20482 Transcript_7247/m.20482 type:complete len:100 (-) Transcript_7247:265-564(-)